jgi:hypothetical protein
VAPVQHTGCDMDYVTANVALQGDVRNIMYRGPDRPVSWPEVGVLQFLHGEDAVYGCEFVRSERSTTQQEKDRLISIYGREPIELVYPGRRPNIDGTFPGERSVPTQAVASPSDGDPTDPALRKAEVRKPPPVKGGVKPGAHETEV